MKIAVNLFIANQMFLQDETKEKFEDVSRDPSFYEVDLQPSVLSNGFIEFPSINKMICALFCFVFLNQ